MAPGTFARRRRRGGRPATRGPILRAGGFTFAERPGVEAPDARLIWRADLDPGVLRVVAEPAGRGDPDAIVPAILAPWLAAVRDARGIEHAVLSDGWRHIRLDVEHGSLAGGAPVILRVAMGGGDGGQAKILSLRRLLHLYRYRRFSRGLFPADRRVARWVLALRVHDALIAGASQREIAIGLFGAERVDEYWRGGSDSMRLNVRRLVGLARRLAQGGYRTLMTRSAASGGDAMGGAGDE